MNCRLDQLLSYTTSLAAQQLATSVAPQQQQQQSKPKAQQKGPQQQQQLAAEHLLLLAWAVAEMDVPLLLQPARELAAAALQAAAGPNCLQQQPGLAARLFQLHVWLSDRQRQAQNEQQPPTNTAAVPVAQPPHSHLSSNSSSSDDMAVAIGPIGLDNALSPEQLQQACDAWLQLQTAALGLNRRLAAVAAALQQLPGVEAVQLQAVTNDGWLVVDVEAMVQGIPVAVLLLDDSDEQQQQDLNATAPTPSSSSNNGSSRCLQDCLGAPATGDLMFRARALAARGYWVVVVSWQQWLLLDGFLDAEVDYLQSKLWLLESSGVNFGANTGENFGGSLSSGDAGVSSGMPVAAAAAAEGVQEDV
jgi:hypothetical protein